MSLNLAKICILLWIIVSHGLCQFTCGRLKVVYQENIHSVDCKIRLYPSEDLQIPIRESHFYRWIVTRNLTPEVILQKNTGNYDTTKYGEENYTLLIRNISKQDEGRYRVHCWTETHLSYFSSEVTVRVPELTTNNPDPPASSVSPEPGLRSDVLIVISICAVIIVAIIAGTIYMIFRRRREETRGVTRLVSDEGYSSNAHPHSVNNDESVYNEINIEDMTTEYAKVNGGRFKPAKKDPRKNPAPLSGTGNLKVAPRNKKDVYSLAIDTDDQAENSKYTEDDYAQVQLICPSENSKDIPAKEKPDYDYVEVSAKADMDSRKKTVEINDETMSKHLGKAGTTNKDEIETSSPEYAKVSKRKDPNNKLENEETTPVTKSAYKISFPEINYSEITQSLGEDCLVQRREPVVYSNLVSRPQRDKSRRSRASRRELQYAILDLSQPGIDSSGDAVKEQIRSQTCQYASIDFEKKAFVAPIRKAPSSWYRRKNKKGKKQSI